MFSTIAPPALRPCRAMYQVPTTPEITTVTGTHTATSRAISSQQDAAMAAHIIAAAMTFARRGMTAPGAMYLTNGPKNRLWINFSVSHGHDRAKHHDATIKNTVVGSPGTTTPTPPIPTQHTPRPASV